MPDLHLSLSYNVFLVVVAVGTALLISYFVYRTTIPPVQRSLRFLLAALRALGLSMLFFLIGEPLLSLISRTVEQPVLAVLVDNSRSMTIQDRLGDRKQQLLKVVESSALKDLNSIGTLQYVLFDAKTRFPSSFSPDSLALNGEGTDIAGVLKKVKEAAAVRNIQGIVLLTDGNFTVGASPLFEVDDIGFPIFTIGIGDTSEQQDVLVRKVLTNNITYAGNRVPVDVTIKSSGFNGERAEVLLRDQNGNVIDRGTITLESGVREYSVPLTFVPEKEGMQKFTVDVSRLPGEVTTENNRSSFYTKVLKSKMRVLLIAGAPSADVAFVRRGLEADKNIEVIARIEQKNGQFYEGQLTQKLIDDADCLFLVGYPVASSPVSTVNLVQSAASAGKGLFFLLGRTVDFSKLSSLFGVLPFTAQRGSMAEYQAFVVVTDAQRNNPIIKLSSAGQSDVWSKLPPIFKMDAFLKAKPEAEVIAQTRMQTVALNDPLLVSRNVNRRKSLALLGYGIWRWKMFSDGVPGAEGLLEEFLSNSIRWLTTREDDRPVRVMPLKEMFAGQDPVEFSAQVYNASYEPLDNAQVTVKIQRRDQTNELMLTSVGSGRYEAVLDPLQEGDYSYTAQVTVDGKKIGEDHGSFSVGGLNVEFLETRMNKLLLEQMAARTGGKYYDATSLESLPKDVASLPNVQPREVRSAKDLELWNLRWSLALVIGIFALEWFLRKRAGML